ncbi:MAG: hypothetical protein HDS40_02075 [Bacteroides sp.]|nr:hypothetical protein [Bacteroides sp.]
MNNRTASALAVAGLLIILAAAALPFFHLPRMAAAITYSAGAALLLAGRLLTKAPEGASLRLKRLLRMEVWAALVFVAGAVFLWMPIKPGEGAGNDWLAFTLAGGILTAYSSLMIPRTK